MSVSDFQLYMLVNPLLNYLQRVSVCNLEFLVESPGPDFNK